MAIDLKFPRLNLYNSDRNLCKSARRYLGNFTCGIHNYYSRNRSIFPKFKAEPELTLAETSQSYVLYLAFFCQDKTGAYTHSKCTLPVRLISAVFGAWGS